MKINNDKNERKKKNFRFLILKYFFVFFSLISLIYLKLTRKIVIKKGAKIGVIGVRHEVNVGNNLLKYAMSIKLSELGFIPYIIGTQWNNYNISFIKSKTNCIVINNSFKEIKEQDYDILMVNSDQTWRRFDEHYFDYGFLRFAEKWNKQKFVYGASLGYEFFNFEKKDINIIKRLLRQFSEISVREKNCIKWIEKHLGMKPFFVLDPTFLINKEYYLNLIKNYKSNKL